MNELEFWFVIGGVLGIALGSLITAHLFWATEVRSNDD